MKKLVAGATGFMGSAIVRALLRDGEAVKVLVRKTSDTQNIDGLDVERAYGDIRDKESVKRSLDGCDTFYLTAAHFQHWNPDRQLPFDINVGGTQAALRAALESGVSKIVYTSTNNTMGAHGSVPSNEDGAFNHWKTGDLYTMSKFLGEVEALKLAAIGLPVVIVNPTFVFGTHDRKPTPAGQLLLDIASGNMPGYIEGMLNIVDVDDVARGQILAAKKGRNGERYLLGHRNMTVSEFFNLVAETTGVKPPRLRLPYPAAVLLGHLYELRAALTRKPPVVTASEVRIGRMGEWYDCSKAVNELGLPQTPIETTVEKAVRWFRGNGYLKPS